MKHKIFSLLSIFVLGFVLNAKLTMAGPAHPSITSFLIKEMGGLRSARVKLSNAHFFFGDTNITPSKTLLGARGDINLAQDIALAFNRITTKKWAVAMSNVAVGKFRKGWSLANTQIFKSTSGTVEALVGMTNEAGTPGVSELDGTIAAINLTHLGAEDLSLAEIKERFFPGEDYFRVATAEETINSDRVVIGKSLVFQGDPASGHIGDVLFDHAVLRLKDEENSYTILNLGSVIGAKHKQWSLSPDLDFSQLLSQDEKIYDACIAELYSGTYTSPLFDELRKKLSDETPYASFDGTNLKSLLNRKIKKDSIEEKQAIAYLKAVMLATYEIIGQEKNDELIAHHLKKIGSVKNFLKIPGQLLSSLGLGSPAGGFDLSHVPASAVSSLSPVKVYERVAKYTESDPKNIILLSEGLIDGFTKSEHGQFFGDVDRDWNSWSKGDNLTSAPSGSFDLGVIAHKDMDINISYYKKKSPYMLLNHGEKNIIDVHFSGDGPISGSSQRAKFLEQLEFCEDVELHDFNKVFHKNTGKNISMTSCAVCGYKSVPRGKGKFKCAR